MKTGGSDFGRRHRDAVKTDSMSAAKALSWVDVKRERERMSVLNELFAAIWNPSFLAEVVKIVLGVFLGGWLPAMFAFRRFRSQKWWETRAEKYQEAIAILSELKYLRDRDLDEEILPDADPISQEVYLDQATHYREAILRLERINNEGAFWFSASCRELLDSYVRNVKNIPKQKTFYDRMQIASQLTDNTLRHFVETAKSDLKLGK